MQEMVIYGVSFDMVGKQPIVLLKTREGNKFLPIWIGHPEAAATMAEYYFHKNQYADSAKYYELATKSPDGDRDVMNEAWKAISYFYLKGLGGKTKDEQRAIWCYAHTHPDMDGTYWLSRMEPGRKAWSPYTQPSPPEGTPRAGDGHLRSQF